MRLFYFKEKSKTFLRHGSENMKKHVSVKRLICKEIFAEVEIIKAFMEMKENGENLYSHSQMFYKIGIPKNFAHFTRKLLCCSNFLISPRSSHPEMFLRKGVLKIRSKFTGDHPCRNVISINSLSGCICSPDGLQLY